MGTLYTGNKFAKLFLGIGKIFNGNVRDSVHFTPS
jgi:hypothetical protein